MMNAGKLTAGASSDPPPRTCTSMASTQPELVSSASRRRNGWRVSVGATSRSGRPLHRLPTDSAEADDYVPVRRRSRRLGTLGYLADMHERRMPAREPTLRACCGAAAQTRVERRALARGSLLCHWCSGHCRPGTLPTTSRGLRWPALKLCRLISQTAVFAEAPASVGAARACAPHLRTNQHVA